MQRVLVVFTLTVPFVIAGPSEGVGFEYALSELMIDIQICIENVFTVEPQMVDEVVVVVLFL